MHRTTLIHSITEARTHAYGMISCGTLSARFVANTALHAYAYGGNTISSHKKKQAVWLAPVYLLIPEALLLFLLMDRAHGIACSSDNSDLQQIRSGKLIMAP